MSFMFQGTFNKKDNSFLKQTGSFYGAEYVMIRLNVLVRFYYEISIEIRYILYTSMNRLDGSKLY